MALDSVKDWPNQPHLGVLQSHLYGLVKYVITVLRIFQHLVSLKDIINSQREISLIDKIVEFIFDHLVT